MDISEFCRCDTTLLVGEPSAGKTFFCLHHPLAKDAVFFDLENRYPETLRFVKDVTIRPEQIINCVKYTKDLDQDYVASFEFLQAEISKHIMNPKIKLIVIDGISDLRNMAAEKWKKDNKKDTIFPTTKWGDINNKVKEIVFRVINFAKVYQRQCIFTAWFTEQYDKDGNKLDKKAIDVKEFIVARLDEVMFLRREGLDFFIKRHKSPAGPTPYVNVTFRNEEKEVETDVIEQKE